MSERQPSLSEKERKSLRDALERKLPPTQRMTRVTFSRIESKGEGKSASGVLRSFCTLDNVSFLLDFKAEISPEGTIKHVEIDR